MALTGKQKAAMLLMSLDTATATELLKGVETEVVEELAVEVAYIDAAGLNNSQQGIELTRQFCDSLRSEGTFNIKSFLKETLKSTVGQEKAIQIQSQIGQLLQKRDPFITIRTALPSVLAPVLSEQHPQAVAVVLSELPSKKSSEIIALLSEGVRLSAVSRMAGADIVSAEAKNRIAQMVSKRIASSQAGEEIIVDPKQSLRKVAIILRNIGKEIRDGLLEAIEEKDGDAVEAINQLMILWDDIPQVADRPLQEALREIDAQKFALALNGADEIIVKKIKSNISERAAEMVEEEASLMAAPTKPDIETAREEIVNALREMNEKGGLSFIEE